MPRAPSLIWKHFNPVNRDSAKCLLCGGIFSHKGGSVSNLKRHLQHKHPSYLEERPDINKAATSLPKVKVLDDRSSDDSETEYDTSRVKRRSIIWNHFIAVDRDSAKCNFCHLRFSFKGGSSTNLKRHLQRKHAFCLEDTEEAPDTSTSQARSFSDNFDNTPLQRTKRSKIEIKNERPKKKSPPVQLSEVDEELVIMIAPESDHSPSDLDLSTATPKRKISYEQTTSAASKKKTLPIAASAQLDEQVVIMVASEYYPLDMIESEGFVKFCQMLNSDYTLPTQETFCRVLLPQLHAKILGTARQLLVNSPDVAITIDEWTSTDDESFQTINVHFVTENSELVSLCIACYRLDEDKSAEQLCEHIQRISSEWGLEQKISAVVSDNRPHISAAIRVSHWQHITCFAHTLNSIVKKALHEVEDIQQRTKSIVEHFKRNTGAMSELKSLQFAGEAAQVKLKSCVPTMWISVLVMFETVASNRNALLAALETTNCELILTAEDFDIIDWCLKVLRPFKDMAAELSERGVTISKNIIFSKMLLNYVTKIRNQLGPSEPQEITQLCDVLLTEIKSNFDGIEDTEICADSTFLDPRFKKLGFATSTGYDAAYKRIVGKMKSSISYQIAVKDISLEELLTKETADNSIWDDFDEEATAANTDLKPGAAAVAEVDKYLREPLLGRKQDPLKWWEMRKIVYPNLYQIMRTRLCIPATSVPSERIFSKTGLRLCERRSRLSPSKTEQIVFINQNLNVLNYQVVFC